MNISKTTQKMIATRDKRCGCIKMSELVERLLQNGSVTVGYRQSCGSTDQTQHDFRMFREIVARLRKDGFNITEEDGDKQKNSYATSKGGFWNESIFRLI